MNSFRKWLYRPRRDDPSLLAQFYYADENLDLIASELDSFDGRMDPEKCTALVNQLRQCQNKILNIWFEMMEDLFPHDRAIRDYRVKFPDEVMQEDLSGQLWFAAECLVAGNIILNREIESTMLRPIAKAVTKSIENVRNLLRDQCLKPIPEYTDDVKAYLKLFDTFFAEFEFGYVSAMVPVKTPAEYDNQQSVIVLFSETLQRALKMNLISQDDVDNYDPVLMFTIPRLAIVCGLFVYPNGPLSMDRESRKLSELFRPFKGLLHKIKELLCTMTSQELLALEKCLCSMDEPDISIQKVADESQTSSSVYGVLAYNSDFIKRFYTNYPSCRQLTPELTLLGPAKKSERFERKRTKSSRSRDRPQTQSERFLSRLTGSDERPRVKRRHKRESDPARLRPLNLSQAQDPSRRADNCDTVPLVRRSQYRDVSLEDPYLRMAAAIERRQSCSVHSSRQGVQLPHDHCTCEQVREPTHHDEEEFMSHNELFCATGNRLEPPPEFVTDVDRRDSEFRLANIGVCVSSVVTADPSLLSPNSIISSEQYPQPASDFERLPSEFSRINIECKRDSVSEEPIEHIDPLPEHLKETPSVETVTLTPGDSSGSTSPHHSGTEDDEEVALALQAAEVAASWRVRERFSDSKDLIHRLFVCISGVADQLQTNYASDLRNILKSVFMMNQSVSEEEEQEEEEEEESHEQMGNEDLSHHSNNSEHLSVESAEDALVAWEASDVARSQSPEEGSDFEEDLLSSPMSNEAPLSDINPDTVSDKSLQDEATTPEDSSYHTPLEEECPHDLFFTEPETEDRHEGQEPSDTSSGLRRNVIQEPPPWILDHMAARCMACGASFTVVRRRHHCRNCGKIFCGHCSSHYVPLPHYGIWKNVRVCNACFVQYLTVSASGSMS